MERRRIRWWQSLIMAVVGVAIAGGGYTLGMVAERSRTSAAVVDPADNGRPPFGLFWEAWDLIQQHYVDRQALEQTRLTHGAIRGVVDALGDDGHSRFLSPKELETQKEALTGRLVGVGVELAIRDGRATIGATFPGAPAERAGLRADDVIIRVDGKDVVGLTLSQVIELVRGPLGTSVTLTILRPGQPRPTDFTVVRETFKLPSVSWVRVPGTTVAQILIGQFNEQTTDELIEALNEARATGVTSVVLDLRNNAGGLLSGAIEAATQFLPEGTVYIEEDAQGQQQPIPVRPGGGAALDLPLVVLVNGGTTSAGEILAGALQGNRRAPLVGTKTFGTGTVLYTYVLSDGSALMLGAVQWLTPDGRALWRQGIAPDVRVDLPANTTPLGPKQVGVMTPEQLQSSKDHQLLRALQETGQAALAR